MAGKVITGAAQRALQGGPGGLSVRYDPALDSHFFSIPSAADCDIRFDVGAQLFVFNRRAGTGMIRMSIIEAEAVAKSTKPTSEVERQEIILAQHVLKFVPYLSSLGALRGTLGSMPSFLPSPPVPGWKQMEEEKNRSISSVKEQYTSRLSKMIECASAARLPASVGPCFTGTLKISEPDRKRELLLLLTK